MIVRTILPNRVMITVSYCGTTKSSVPHFNAVRMKRMPRIDMNGLCKKRTAADHGSGSWSHIDHIHQFTRLKPRVAVILILQSREKNLRLFAPAVYRVTSRDVSLRST